MAPAAPRKKRRGRSGPLRAANVSARELSAKAPQVLGEMLARGVEIAAQRRLALEGLRQQLEQLDAIALGRAVSEQALDHRSNRRQEGRVAVAMSGGELADQRIGARHRDPPPADATASTWKSTAQ